MQNEPKNTNASEPGAPRKKRSTRRSPKDESCSPAVQLARRLQRASTLDELRAVLISCRRSPALRALFPADPLEAGLVIDAALEAARREVFTLAGLDDAFEFESLFRLVRALWRALLPDVSRHDLRLADACQGAAFVFVRAVLVMRPDLEPERPERLDALAMSLETRWREVWEKTRQADGEDILEAAVREARFLRVIFRKGIEGATALHERMAAIAFAFQDLVEGEPFALPQERLAAILGHPRQRTGDLIRRLVRWKVLEIVSEFDWKAGRAATYRIDPKKARRSCLVNRQ